MSLRVIAGSAKGRRLKMVPGGGTRPISDQVKESLFNILADEIIGATFLDLFAGTGSVGIEALSRGAGRAVFVESERGALKVLSDNLTHTGLTKAGQVVRGDVFRFLSGPRREAFDFIYIAPPQYKLLWRQTLESLDAKPDWLNPDGVAIIQIHPVEFVELPLKHLLLDDKRKYGSTLLGFYEKPGE